MRKKKSIGSIVVTCILLGTIVFSGIKLYEGFEDYWDAYLKSLSMQELADRNNKQVDFKKLREKNKDIIGWLYCKGTVIDYPVVQGKDNETYLHTGPDGKWSGSGTLFVDCNNESPFKEKNTIIYGHHMRDGSMFHDLDLWQSKSYVKKHPVIYLYTPSQNYKLKVIASKNVAATNEAVYSVPYYSNDEMRSFLNDLKDAPMKTKRYNQIVSSEKSISLVTLSTCAYTFEDARTILVTETIPVSKSVTEIEKDKPEPESKFTVFCRMIKEIVKEGISEL